jgi:hypothetical protein
MWELGLNSCAIPFPGIGIFVAVRCFRVILPTLRQRGRRQETFCFLHVLQETMHSLLLRGVYKPFEYLGQLEKNVQTYFSWWLLIGALINVTQVSRILAREADISAHCLLSATYRKQIIVKKANSQKKRQERISLEDIHRENGVFFSADKKLSCYVKSIFCSSVNKKNETLRRRF